MQLALDMGATLGELNQRMSSKEYSLWSALHQMQPRGVVRDNFHSAIIANLLANIHAPKGKKYAIHDFMHEDTETKNTRKQQDFFTQMRALSIPKKTK